MDLDLKISDGYEIRYVGSEPRSGCIFVVITQLENWHPDD
jgi:hypothetical protein